MDKKIVLIIGISALLLSSISTLKFDGVVKASPSVIRVPQDYQTIQAAINAANPGDTIQVAKGTYNESITIDNDKDNLELVGEDRNTTIINGLGNDYVVYLDRPQGTTIRGFTVRNGYNGISMSLWSSGINIIDNIITGNDNFGIITGDQCGPITISENIIVNNGAGVNVFGSTSITIKENTIIDNYYEGIELTGAEWKQEGSSYNIVIGNTLVRNGLGIRMNAYSTGNTIYHNNFVNNTEQADASLATNVWDNGYPSGGNYWSDYTGIDTNGDGIGDTPYIIDENNEDRYPFINQKISSHVTINIDPTTVTKGSDVTISGTITPTRANVNVTIQYQLEGEEAWTTLETVKTDSNGHYTYAWKTTKTGTYKVKASWLGDQTHFSAESETKTVQVKAKPVGIIPYAITGAVAIVILAAVILYLVKIRKR